MKLRRAFKLDLRPNGAQVRRISRCYGLRRVVFNSGFALQQERHASGARHLSDAGFCRHLTAWKADPATL